MAATGRRGARRLLVQALYQWQIAAHSPEDLRRQFEGRAEFARVDSAWFRKLLEEVTGSRDELDALIGAEADRPVAQLDPVERGILWLGAAELKFHPEVPARVVINEAVDLAREFGAQDGHRYVNALLDRLAMHLR